jgi:hypothetical protein
MLSLVQISQFMNLLLLAPVKDMVMPHIKTDYDIVAEGCDRYQLNIAVYFSIPSAS